MEDERGIYIKPTTGLPEGQISQKIDAQKPELTVIQGGKSDTKNPEGIYIKPTTGLPEGQIGLRIEPQGPLTKLKRALSKLVK